MKAKELKALKELSVDELKSKLAAEDRKSVV